jgi:hypothetical protein
MNLKLKVEEDEKLRKYIKNLIRGKLFLLPEKI